MFHWELLPGTRIPGKRFVRSRKTRRFVSLFAVVAVVWETGISVRPRIRRLVTRSRENPGWNGMLSWSWKYLLMSVWWVSRMRVSQLCYPLFPLQNRRSRTTRLPRWSRTWESWITGITVPLWWLIFPESSRVLIWEKVWDCVFCDISNEIQCCCLWSPRIVRTFTGNIKYCWTNWNNITPSYWIKNDFWLSANRILLTRNWWPRWRKIYRIFPTCSFLP